MDFNDYTTIPKIPTTCNPHVQSLAPVTQTSVLTNAYHSTIDKNDLQSLSIHGNHSMHENHDSTTETDGAK